MSNSPADMGWQKRSSEETDVPPLCEACEEGDECKWIAFTNTFVKTEAWTAVVDGNDIVEERDRNRMLRRCLYRNFVCWDGQSGHERVKIPKCIRDGVRNLYPSGEYMGHTDKKRKRDPLAATDIDGKVIEGVWWVYEDKSE